MRKLWFALLLSCSSTPAQEAPPPPAAPPPPPPPVVQKVVEPPVAKKTPTIRQLHGEKFVDEYFWLRQRDSADVAEYLKAEAAYTADMMKPFAALQDVLYQKIISHIAQDDDTVPAKDGDFVYWSRVEKGKNYSTHLRKKIGTEQEQVILDVNALAQGKAFMGIGEF